MSVNVGTVFHLAHPSNRGSRIPRIAIVRRRLFVDWHGACMIDVDRACAKRDAKYGSRNYRVAVADAFTPQRTSSQSPTRESLRSSRKSPR